MARSAAAKKVAKAASTGGGGAKVANERSYLFPAAMALVVVLGIFMIFVARGERSDNAPRGAPEARLDHWHSAYQIYQCGEIVPTVYPDDSVEDLTGIHSHGDGLLHIHPFISAVSGQFATLGVFFDEGEWELTDSSIELPSGTIIRESDFSCGGEDGEPAEIRVLRWNSVDAETALVFTEDLAKVGLSQNGQLFTFAIVDPSTDSADIPRPDDAFLRTYLGIPENNQPEVPGAEVTTPAPTTAPATTSAPATTTADDS